MSGKVGSGITGSEDTLKKNLEYALPLLKENGIVGLIEPINKYFVPGYFLNNYETGLEHISFGNIKYESNSTIYMIIAQKLINELNSPNLRLQLDVFHMQFIRGDLTNSIKELMPITGP